MQARIEKLLLSVLRKAADDRLAVTVLANTKNGLWLIHDMSTDPRVFLAAMDRVAPETKTVQAQIPDSEEFSKAVAQEVQQLQQLTKVMPSATGYKSMSQAMARRNVGRGELQTEQSGREDVEVREIESLRQVGATFQRSRKRKLLVWLTQYFPIVTENGELAYGRAWGVPRPHIRPDMTEAYERAIDALNGARISVYPAFVPDSTYDYQLRAKDTLDGLEEVGRRTGGKMLGVLDNVDLSAVTAGLRKDFDSYYILTFTLNSVRKDSWVESIIKPIKPDVNIAVARGFFAEPQNGK